MGDRLDRFHRSLHFILRALPLTLDPQQLALLDRHFELLERWNRKLNLTSVRDPEQIATRHFGESLFVASVLPVGPATLADIGSGAGFPGVPIAVVRPQLQVSLIESIGKKAVFLKEVTRPLSNAQVLRDRFENLPICFHWATMRGVATGSLWDVLSLRARNVVLIGGRDRLHHRLPQEPILWQPEIPLPWEPSRVLLVGSVRQPPTR
jgi:16S rRNA (guanine527-N7)-methyltransferase